MLHIRRCVSGLQRPEVIARGDALRKLTQIWSRQHLGQLWLTDKNDAQQFAFVGFQIGQQAQLLQHVRREVLRLVNEQYGGSSGSITSQQLLVDVVHQSLDAAVRIAAIDTQFIGDGFEELHCVQPRIEHECNVDMRWHLLKQTATQRGLARADLAGQHHKAALIVQAIDKMRERIAMSFGQIQKSRIWRDGKRPLTKPKVLFVHACSVAQDRVARSRRAFARLFSCMQALILFEPQSIEPIADVRAILLVFGIVTPD